MINFSWPHPNSLITKVNLIVIIGATIVLTLFGIYQYEKQYQRLSEQLRINLHLTTQRLANSIKAPLYNYDEELIRNVIKSEMENKEISAVYIHEFSLEGYSYGYVRNGDLIEWNLLEIPIKQQLRQSRNLEYSSMHLGEVVVFISTKYLDENLREALIAEVFKILVCDIVIVFLIISLLNMIVINPIKQLETASAEMASGRLNRSIDIQSDDEIGVMARSFLKMRGAIIEKIENLEEQKEALRESHSARQEFIDAMTTLSAKLTIDGILEEINETAIQISDCTRADVLGRPFVECDWWNYSSEVQFQLNQSIASACQGNSISYNTRIRVRGGNLMDIAFNVQPVKENDNKVKYLIVEGRDITDLIKTKAELQKHKDNLEEIVKERTSELLSANRSLARLKTAIEQSVDGVFVTDKEGRIIFANPSLARMHEMEMESLYQKDFNCFYSPEGSSQFEIFKNQVWSNGFHEGELTHIRSDGDEFPAWVSLSMMQDQDDIIGFVGIIRDISSQKEDARKLATAQKELVEKAHRAGMAEIATSALHNIGNILNSIKTSVQMMNESTLEQVLFKMNNATQIIKDNAADLEYFVKNDPKAITLFTYFIKLGEILESENEAITYHVRRLSEMVNAVTEVVSSQQTYAGFDSLTEKYQLNEIVEDALNFETGLMRKHNVTLIKDFRSIPYALIQKTKLVHIIINLIRNAIDAMLNNDRENRKLTIVIEEDQEYAFIRVTDTGIGIPESQIGKIFSHGFTTKTGGHGFGLHSCANYMNEMHGKIWVESKDNEPGSTFNLRFNKG